jgi:cold shock CspA family protein
MPYQLGQHLEFAVSTNNRGQPQAIDVQWLPLLEMPRSRQFMAAAPTTPEVAHKNRYIGSLKSYSSSQGYGFIHCDSIFETHTRDVYLDRSGLPPSGEWRLGQVVEIDVIFNKRGHPQARNCSWDSVHYLPRLAPHGSTAVAQPFRPIDSGVVRALDKIMVFIRQDAWASALRLADERAGLVEDKRAADSGSAAPDYVDFLMFVFDHMGPPRATANENAALLVEQDAEVFQALIKSLLLRLSSRLKTFADVGSDEYLTKTLSWFCILLDILMQEERMDLRSKISSCFDAVKVAMDAASRERGLRPPAEALATAGQKLTALMEL